MAQSVSGTYPVLVQIADRGYSNSNFTFKYDLVLNSLSSLQGSAAGGLSLVLNGSGFDSSLTTSNSTLVTVCGNVCKIVQSSYASLTFIVIFFDKKKEFNN